MNNCCKFELRKAMQGQRDVAITVGMALGLIETFWKSQFANTQCAYGCREEHGFHEPACKFVAAWNAEEMQYLRYSLGIEHTVKVK